MKYLSCWHKFAEECLAAADVQLAKQREKQKQHRNVTWPVTSVNIHPCPPSTKCFWNHVWSGLNGLPLRGTVALPFSFSLSFQPTTTHPALHASKGGWMKDSSSCKRSFKKSIVNNLENPDKSKLVFRLPSHGYHVLSVAFRRLFSFGWDSWTFLVLAGET